MVLVEDLAGARVAHQEAVELLREQALRAVGQGAVRRGVHFDQQPVGTSSASQNVTLTNSGTAGAPACVMNAVNDALAPLGAKLITEMPMQMFKNGIKRIINGHLDAETSPDFSL